MPLPNFRLSPLASVRHIQRRPPPPTTFAAAMKHEITFGIRSLLPVALETHTTPLNLKFERTGLPAPTPVKPPFSSTSFFSFSFFDRHFMFGRQDFPFSSSVAETHCSSGVHIRTCTTLSFVAAGIPRSKIMIKSLACRRLRRRR